MQNMNWLWIALVVVVLVGIIGWLTSDISVGLEGDGVGKVTQELN